MLCSCPTHKTCLTRLIKYHFTNITVKILKNPKCINLLVVVVFFFFLTYCDWLFVILRYVLILNDYL